MSAHEFDSVWDAIETDAASAANLRLRARLSDALKGKIEKCTTAQLLCMLKQACKKS
jgi:predicted XRE-type DNA-binding protein